MNVFPSELEIRRQADDLLDALLTASGVYMTSTQQARAAAEIETRLIELRRQWAQPVQAIGRDYQRHMGGAR